MTQKDKELLLKDLCARLPYGVKIQCWYGQIITSDINTFPYSREEMAQEDMEDQLEGIKPYLRPMSSMTFEEYRESPISRDRVDIVRKYRIDENGFHFIKLETFDVEILDWLNAHHFDYRGLIEKGLALEAPEGMYKND